MLLVKERWVLMMWWLGGKSGMIWESGRTGFNSSAIFLLIYPYRSPNTSISLLRPSTYFRGHPEGWAGLRDLTGIKHLPFLNNRGLYVMTAVDTAVWYAWKLLMRVNPKSSEEKQNVCNYMRRWMLSFCGNHFTIYVREVIMQHSLSLHRTVCQLYLHKTEKIKN